MITHISRKYPNTPLYAYEKDIDSVKYMETNQRHPYFFPEVLVPKNIQFVHNLQEILPSIDVIILVIPNQFIEMMIAQIKSYLKNGVVFVNLSKGINSTSLRTVSDILLLELNELEYTYSVLSGGMIAQELVDGTILGADIGVSNLALSDTLREIFETQNLKIEITSSYKDIELYGALKNIAALYVGYLEGRGIGYSSIGFSICILLREMQILIVMLGGSNIGDFSDFSFGGDLIATCFGKSRNRYLGQLIGSGSSTQDALNKLRLENKHAEGYETLKGLGSIIQSNSELVKLKEIYNAFIY